jgi:hypothetical protein
MPVATVIAYHYQKLGGICEVAPGKVCCDNFLQRFLCHSAPAEVSERKHEAPPEIG